MAIDGLAGDIAIETRAAAEIVIVSEPLTEPEVAVTVAVPFPSVVTIPELLTARTLEGETIHDTVSVMFWVLPSVKVPVTLSCCMAPLIREGFGGVIANEVKSGVGTVITAEVVIKPALAVMVALPELIAETRPAGLTAATFAGAVVQATLPVTSWVVPSLKPPTTESC